MAATTLKDLAPLLARFRGDGEVLSCYTDLAGADGFRRHWHAPLEMSAENIRRKIGQNETARSYFDRNLAAIRSAIKAADSSDGRWLGVFAAKQREFFQAVPLEMPVDSVLVTDQSPYLVPLLSAIHRHREYLAVHSDTHRARLYSATPGKIGLIDELSADVPARQHSSGEMWGQSQATIARHREDAILHFRKDIVFSIERAWAQQRLAGLVLVGAHPALEHLRQALPGRLGARVVQEMPESWYEQPAAFAAKLQETVLQTLKEDETSAIEDVWDRLASNRAVVTGATAVLAALQTGKIGADGHGYLVLGPDPRETVGRCTSCNVLADGSPSTCPRCQSPCAMGNLWEELLLMALRHHVRAYFVDDSKKLAPYGGLVAALTKP